MKKCIFCKIDTTNPKFCSRSCAVSYNNSKNPKRQKKIRHCTKCGKDTNSSWQKVRLLCNNCIPKMPKTKADFINKRAYQIHSQIREKARKLYIASDKPQHCVLCGYDKHFHVCHIKAIKDFDNTATVTEINDLTNLVALCPNHHWEFDNNLLSLP